MIGSQLYQFFKDKGVTPQEIAIQTGYSYGYIIELLRGTEPLTDGAKFRILDAYPETALFLLNNSEKTEQGTEETRGDHGDR